MSKLTALSPDQLSQRMAQGSVALIDIREADEYARQHIAAAKNYPLSTLPERLEYSADSVVFTCRTGNRTSLNADRLAALVPGEAYVLDGGLEAWKSVGLPTQLDKSKPIEMMRQVQMIAGTLILLGILLGTLVNPGFYGLSGFVGAGLFVAGATGFCGMARLLALAPWNRVSAS